MANTYTQLYVQFVFATQYRLAQIQPEWETELFKYITGIVKNNKHKGISKNSALPSPFGEELKMR